MNEPMEDKAIVMEKKQVVCFTCSQQCGHIAVLKDGRVERLMGDKDHPRTAGFICPKGAHAPKLHASPDRLHHPLKRVGPRGGGQWEPIGWDQVLDEIAQRIMALVQSDSAESIAYSYGTVRSSDAGIGARFMNLLGSPNSVGQDKICLGPTALGEYLTYGFGPSVSCLQGGVTECLLLWGARPIESARVSWRTMETALKQGTRLIVIDPVRTQEAERADLWLQPRPGTDAALGLGLLNHIMTSGRYQAEMADQHGIGFDDLRQRAADYPPERVTAITGVPADSIVQAAEWISGRGPTAFVGGNGLCQSGVTAVQHGRILACLIALTGNLNRPGGNMLYGPPRDILSNGDWMAMDALPPKQRVKALGASRFGGIGDYDRLDRLAAQAWHGKRWMPQWISTAHEPSMWRAILTQKPYPVRALIIQGHNPVGGSANTGEARAALLSNNLELLVAHDLFLNGTSSMADYVLPAAHWLEKPYFSLGAASLAWFGDYVEANHATIAPEHDHRSDYDLFRDLGWRCGQREYWPETAEDFYEDLLAPAKLHFGDVAAHLGPIAGAQARHPDHADSTPLPPHVYGTLSGKVEFRSALLADWGQDPLPHYRRPALFNQARDYPMILMTGGRQIEGFHQNAQQTPAFRRKNPHPQATIHPDTAHALGIEEGDWVDIETPVGRIRQMARIADNYLPDVIHAERWWYPEGTQDPADPFGIFGTSVNMCTSNADDDVDPVMGSWLLRGLPCRIGSGGGFPVELPEC